MPLTLEQKELKKKIFQSLKDEAIEPTNNWYVPLYSLPNCQDPIDKLREIIEFNDVESTQFFSGFRGSGKTTELFRLRRELVAQGYLVLYADALEYINPADEIDITDLLLVLAMAFSDALKERGLGQIEIDSHWERFKNWLYNTEISMPEVTGKTKLSALGFAETEASFKLALRTTPTFRQELQKALSNRIGELKEKVNAFIQDGVKAIQKAKGEDTRIVFIFDSLEQIRGSLFNEQDVIQSVERVFSLHHRLLELPFIHTIYAVPPWLKLVVANHPKQTVMLHSVKQWLNDDERTKYEDGKNIFRKLIVKRFEEDGFRKFFGEDWNAATETKADRLINLCGGHFRDLLRMLREAVLTAKDLPISDSEIETAIANVRSNFLPISQDDAKWLSKIAESRSLSEALENLSGENVGKVARYLDTHLVLYLKNGDEWYDIHPLIYDEVKRIVERTRAAELKEKETSNE
jgi:hypothetical protein